MVIWITGLSGSGKTTIGKDVTRMLAAENPAVVRVDGDDVRRMLGLDQSPADYTLEGRFKVAQRLADLCAWLDGQNLNVVCCTMSFFDELRKSNRTRFSSYLEVYISVPMQVLFRRDPNRLYARARQGEIRNVVGVDIPFAPPSSADLVIDNAVDRTDFADVAAEIIGAAHRRRISDAC